MLCRVGGGAGIYDWEAAPVTACPQFDALLEAAGRTLSILPHRPEWDETRRRLFAAIVATRSEPCSPGCVCWPCCVEEDARNEAREESAAEKSVYQELLWCPNCMTPREYRHSGPDFVCEDCHFILATFHPRPEEP